MKIGRAVVFALLCSLVAAPAQAQIAIAPPWPAEVTVPFSHHLKFTSSINGESYTLLIQVPSIAPPPPGGYPVIYVLDGAQFFGTASDINLAGAGRTAVVVAIGHGLLEDMAVVAQYAGRKAGDNSPIGPADIGQATNALRFHDLALPVAPAHRAPAWTGLTPDSVGGLDDFLRVIETEIKPKVAALVHINPADSALFGHSIGGLAVLRALFTEPTAFRTFIAASPSIWWDANSVLADENNFDKAVESGRASPRVLITVGAEEPDKLEPPQAFLDSLPPDRKSDVIAYVKMAGSWEGMISGARNLAGRLGKLHGGSNYKVEFVSFPGERHETVPPAALSRGMHFALETQP